ncbi:ferredoxin [Actinomadura meyerae]|jgi:ferredoxin|uniref:Ferredoxin n=1 Tax=Actinomadura meyerae TaxID=240840 RepID=A0A239NFU9_9ACTN|nr:ferredoxin [Actinomadura meyerae]
MLVLDRAECIGAGQCVLHAPELFDQDDDAGLVVLRRDIAERDLDAVRTAVEACPSGALRLAGRRDGGHPPARTRRPENRTETEDP